jgi:hypothetical protein
MQTCGFFLRKKPVDFIDFHCSNPEAARESGGCAGRDSEVALQSTRRFGRGARRLHPGLWQALPVSGRGSQDASPGAEKWSHFGIDFEPLSAKNGPKTAKNGSKSASSSY